jgi:hypothetical protein
MGVAFDQVCRALDIENQPMFLKEVVARKIVELAREGADDPTQLRDQAIRELRVKP